MIRTQVLQKEDFTMSKRKNVALKLTAANYVQRQPTKTANDPKLSKALDDFDRILDDFMSVPPQEKTSKIPKLQKSKTCCVIESKCVYKRTLSLQNGDPDRLKVKTKSLHDLNKESTISSKHDQKTENVKETIRRFNSLTTPSPPSRKNSSKSMKLDGHKTISRTTSMGSEYSEDRKSSISRIPVNTNLRRSFPSTPLGLNKLDQQNGSLQKGKTDSKMQSKFSKSVQNLNKTSRTLSLHSPTTNLPKKNVELSKSVQNLNFKSSKMTLSAPKPPKNNLELSKSIHNLNRIPSKPPLSRTSNINSKTSVNLSKSVQNLSKNQPRLSTPKQKILPGSELSKSTINLNKSTSKTTRSTLKKVEHSKSFQNLSKLAPRLSLPVSSDLGGSVQNLRKQVSLDTNSNRKRRDFVNPSMKSARSTPNLHKDNIELKMREMKKVIEAKIDQQLKELSLDDPDEQVQSTVKTKVEHFSKPFEDRVSKDDNMVIRTCKDNEMKNIMEKFSGDTVDYAKPIAPNNCDTFKKKMSTFSCFSVDECVDLNTPPKVIPRTKKKKKMIADLENQNPLEQQENHKKVEVIVEAKNKDVFGVKKHTVEPRFTEVTMKNLVQQRKKHFMRNFEVDLNLENIEQLRNIIKGRSEKRDMVKKIDSSLSYGSDDSSSDDSGNISTEIENEDVFPVDIVKKDLVVSAPKIEQVNYIQTAGTWFLEHFYSNL